MTRRARLTLISVGLVALLTGTISSYYLIAEIERQFQFALQHTDTMKSMAADNVARSLERQSSLPIPEALTTDADLGSRLQKIMTVSRSLLEIAICDQGNHVLLSTDSSRRAGDPFPQDYPDYRQLVNRAGLLEKIKVIRDESAPKYYQLTEAMG